MKTIALCAVILAASTAPGFSVCKHHFTALASASDFNGPLINAPASAQAADIKKCIPNCGG